jgi:glutamyl-tRNA(Gln) amidotransferase subunit E
MYPETDVPPFQLSPECVEKLSASIPELPEVKMSRLTEDYGLNSKLAKQMLDSEYINLFPLIIKESTVSATVVAVALTETIKALKRDGVDVERISDTQVRELFILIGSGRLAKEAIPEVLTWLAEHEGNEAEESIKALGLEMLSRKELENEVEKIVRENAKLVEERKMGAASILMGVIMKKFRGRVEAKQVGELVRKQLEMLVG